MFIEIVTLHNKFKIRLKQTKQSMFTNYGMNRQWRYIIRTLSELTCKEIVLQWWQGLRKRQDPSCFPAKTESLRNLKTNPENKKEKGNSIQLSLIQHVISKILHIKQTQTLVTMTADTSSGYCHRSSGCNIIYCLPDGTKRPHYIQMKVY